MVRGHTVFLFNSNSTFSVLNYGSAFYGASVWLTSRLVYKWCVFQPIRPQSYTFTVRWNYFTHDPGSSRKKNKNKKNKKNRQQGSLKQELTFVILYCSFSVIRWLGKIYSTIIHVLYVDESRMKTKENIQHVFGQIHLCNINIW